MNIAQWSSLLFQRSICLLDHCLLMDSPKSILVPPKRKGKPGEDCLPCRILGSGTCFGISIYAYTLFRKAPLTKVGDRRFDAALCLLFAALGVYRAVLY